MTASNVLSDYFEALERLKAGSPINVPSGTKITNDAVALEAGRGKGSIKKSREIFDELIEAIREAVETQGAAHKESKQLLKKVRNEVNKYRSLYEEALVRELSLLYEVEELKAENKKLKDH